MATLWNGVSGMKIDLKFSVTNHDEKIRISIYLAEDGRWFVIRVELANPRGTTEHFFDTLPEALDLAKIRDMRSIEEDECPEGQESETLTTWSDDGVVEEQIPNWPLARLHQNEPPGV